MHEFLPIQFMQGFGNIHIEHVFAHGMHSILLFLHSSSDSVRARTWNKGQTQAKATYSATPRRCDQD